MADINDLLESLSEEELRQLRAGADIKLHSLQVNRTEEAIAAAQAVIASVGLTMTVHTPGAVVGRGGTAPAKYRLPDGTEWSGRGRMNRVFKEYLAVNPEHTIEDFRIRDDEQPLPFAVEEEEEVA